jgi:hypothetical protein
LICLVDPLGYETSCYYYKATSGFDYFSVLP